MPRLQLKLAQVTCRCLPPIVAQRCRAIIYPYRQAKADNLAFTVRSQTGSLFSGTTSEFHAYPFSVQGYYEWRHWAIALALLAEGDGVVEVGANIGTETVGFSDLVGPSGRVIAFEPVPANVARLQAALAQCRHRNSTVLPFAVGDCDGSATFVLPPDDNFSGVGHLASGTGEPQAAITVRCVTLDTVLKEESPVKMIFIDAEGAELSILQGAQHTIAAHRPSIVLEANPKWLRRAGASLEALASLIADLGYTPYRIGRIRLHPIAALPDQSSNWLLLPGHSQEAVEKVNRTLRSCALLPCVGSLNPLRTRRKS